MEQIIENLLEQILNDETIRQEYLAWSKKNWATVMDTEGSLTELQEEVLAQTQVWWYKDLLMKTALQLTNKFQAV